MGTRLKYVVEIESRKGRLRMTQTFDSNVPKERWNESLLRMFEQRMEQAARVLSCEVYDFEAIS